MWNLRRPQPERPARFRCRHRRALTRGDVSPTPITLLEIPPDEWDFFRLCFFPETTGNTALVAAEPPVNLLLYARYRVDPGGLLILHRGRIPARPGWARRHARTGTAGSPAGEIAGLLSAAAEFH